MTPEEVADSKELPLAAVLEAIEYCQTHRNSPPLVEDDRGDVISIGFRKQQIL